MKKTVREMSHFQKTRHGLTFKTMINVVLITTFIGIVLLLAGAVMHVSSAVMSYSNSLCQNAAAEAGVLDMREVKQTVGNILGIYDSIPDRVKKDGNDRSYHKAFSNTMDANFRDVQFEMRRMRDRIGLRNALIVAIDDRTNRMIYLIDSDEHPESFCWPGTWDDYSERDIQIFLNGTGDDKLYRMLGIRGDYQATVTKLGQYGWRVTGAHTLYKADDYTIMIILDETLDVLKEMSMIFLFRYLNLLVIAIGIGSLVAVYRIKKNVVTPIEQMASAASGYANDKMSGVSGSDHFSKLNIKTGDEIEELSMAMSDMECSLAEYEINLTRVTAEKERINTELNLAARIQESALPGSFPLYPDHKDFDIYASMTPAREVGGDFYDILLLDDDHLAVVIADVSGKGIPAALFMMVSQMLLRHQIRAVMDPAKALETVNNQACYNNTLEMFVTVWIGILDLRTGVMTASNAGHEYPVIMHEGGDFEVIRDRHGLVVGGMEDVPYSNYDIQMKPGSKLFVYTDGLAEAQGEDEEFFGLERAVETLNEIKDDTPEQILTGVKKAVLEFQGNAPQFDDLTMMCIQYNGR